MFRGRIRPRQAHGVYDGRRIAGLKQCASYQTKPEWNGEKTKGRVAWELVLNCTGEEKVGEKSIGTPSHVTSFWVVTVFSSVSSGWESCFHSNRSSIGESASILLRGARLFYAFLGALSYFPHAPRGLTWRVSNLN